MSSAKEKMNKIYRWQVAVYDAFRSFYLFGRNRLLNSLDLKPEDILCEVGSGTARNLIYLAKKYPHAIMHGYDVSSVMCDYATKKLKKKNLNSSISVFEKDFCYEDLDLKSKLNHVLFIYSLSMMENPQFALKRALNLLDQEGEIHIVDFGSHKKMPKILKKIHFIWLRLFHVRYVENVEIFLRQEEENQRGILKKESYMFDFYQTISFKKKL